MIQRYRASNEQRKPIPRLRSRHEGSIIDCMHDPQLFASWFEDDWQSTGRFARDPENSTQKSYATFSVIGTGWKGSPTGGMKLLASFSFLKRSPILRRQPGSRQCKRPPSLAPGV